MQAAIVVSVVALWPLTLCNLALLLVIVRRLDVEGAGGFPSAGGLDIGTPAPDFAAETPEGQTVRLGEFAGRSLAMVFVSPTCAPCRAALPELAALRPRAALANVEILLVSGADTDATRAFATELPPGLPILLAPSATNGLLSDYRVSATPSFCLVDTGGMVQSVGLVGASEPWRSVRASWERDDEDRIARYPREGGGLVEQR